MNSTNYILLKEKLPKNVSLLAVSKGFDSAHIRFLHGLGQRNFGESKLQEYLDKNNYLRDINDIKWHFIGRIQSNKIRKIVQNFDYIHSVDSYEKLIKISKVSLEIGKFPKIMVQVKLEDDPTKGGMPSEDLIKRWQFIEQIEGLNIVGLMTINPRGLQSNENFELFKKCRLLANSLNLIDCSMGMSQDWRQAIEAGSTWIRVGSHIFGER